MNNTRSKQYHFLILPLLAATLTMVTLTGCELYKQDDYVEQFVVESYLIAHREMPEVRLSTTAPFDENYYFNERAVSDADVRIIRYDDNGIPDKTYHYSEIQQGIYVPAIVDQDDLVFPRRRYKLEIDLPEEDDLRIEAWTSVPDTFSVKEVIRDRARYQSQEQLEFRVTRNRTNNRQNFFIYSTEALEPSENNMTPFWKDVTDDYQDAVQIRTEIVNEENFEVNPDGTLTLRMPWIGIAFFGPNIISAYSLDDNAYDFYRSQPVQTGGGNSTIAPGEIQNIIYHVDGGIGLFSSMSVLEMNVTVDRPESGSPGDPGN